MAIHLMKPLFIVDAGPCPGVYFSERTYQDHLGRSGIQHPLDMMGEEMKLSMPAHTGDPELSKAVQEGEGMEEMEREEASALEAEREVT